MVEARYQPVLDGIGGDHEDNGNSAGRRHRGLRRGHRAGRDEDRDVLLREFHRQCRQAIVMVVGPAILDDDVLAFGEPGLAQAPADGKQGPRLPRGRRRAAEKADDRDDTSARLRARHGGPGGRSGTQQQKIAPSHAPAPPQGPAPSKVSIRRRACKVFPVGVTA